MAEHAGRVQTLTKIDEGNWDFVLLQENLILGVLSADDYQASVVQLDQRVRRVGAESLLIMLWGSKFDARVTFEAQRRVNQEIAESLGIRVAPLGLAWHLARQERPELRLYAKGSDGANMAGDFLNAALLLTILLDVDPRMSNYIPEDEDGLPLLTESDAAFLRAIAWQASTMQP